ncbi:MAG: D-glycero-beta-D-manno-heptose-7-phosphate kinase [Chloroflexi bacterium]|nr:D-glycero-beta-D-manno-heptose-7-phosphate kinase [Chloroflexota bacterium]
MLDEYLWGTVARISPEAPIPVVDVQRVTYVPGGAGNVAANIAALGGQVTLLGIVGADEAGARLREALTERHISHRLCADAARPTTLKTRVVAHNQQVVRVDREQRAALGEETARRLLAAARQCLADCDVLLLSDYDKGALPPPVTGSLVALARAASRPVFVDPKGADYAKYRGATLLTPNVVEASRAARIEIADEESLVQAARRLLEQVGCQALLVTGGDRGMWLCRPDGPAIHLEPQAREVFDVTGAGDTVVGVLALGVAAGLELQDAARVANHAAGVVVGKVGTATLSLQELRSALAAGG